MKDKITEQWHKEAAYAHFIDSIPGIGVVMMEKLYTLYGGDGGYENVYYQLEKIVKKGREVCKEMPAFDKKQMEGLEVWMMRKDVKKEYEKLLYNKLWCIPKYSYGYPDKLKYLYRAPNVLYVKGRLPSPDIPVVAVVGARNCSPYGEMMAKELGGELATAGLQVISGMARGIDGITQRSALQYGGTVFGVLGCGVDICYPEENRDIYQRMVSETHSGIISEYTPGTKPAPGMFPMRNRIISGLADVLVVVEAREQSGSYSTVINALEQGKDVYVIPGRIGDSLSFGCNRLIGQGANVIYDIKQFVADILGSSGVRSEKVSKQNNNSNERIANSLSDVERCIYTGMDIQYCPAEEVLAKTVPQLDFSEGIVLLSTLECKGLVESQSGFYRKKT